MTRAVAVVVLLLGLVGAGCSDQKEKYCDAVKDHQQELGEVLGEGCLLYTSDAADE